MPKKRPKPTRKKLTSRGQEIKAARVKLQRATARIQTMRQEKVIQNEAEAAAIKLYLLYMSHILNGTRKQWTKTQKKQIEWGKKLYDSKQGDYFPEMQPISNMFGKIAFYQDDTLWYNKAMSYTSEPIPDYIMKSLQPKKSVHPEYGKLRY